MSKLIIANLLILNMVVLYQQNDSILPFLIGIALPGIYKGITAQQFNQVFNLHKVKYSFKAPQRKLELFCAFLTNLSTDVSTYKELFTLRVFPNLLETLAWAGYSILFTFLMYRFLFLNMFKNEEKA
ncbi:hypothetical protein H1Z61_13495 [Bacillus aquiflavi]|uniref:Uncharacterized protein n=1 Tax=Bacillus aquiflavi TaxID=2672567 RepID=A0A6B3W3K8_9BACI|nr:hypothetical protein [Bacillus aquiflavi]MBA4538121.1 hypothetical protein [Bacillus aquiflavi]NEY82441.1 hypothetical protein [Bacillus aquiflavi]UAC48587.1 hypothetical protein K6959_00855 [Bacillus aquiflavi]